MKNRGICSKDYWYNKKTKKYYLKFNKSFINNQNMYFYIDGMYFDVEKDEIHVTKMGDDIIFDGYYDDNNEWHKSHNDVTFCLLNDLSECFNLGYHSEVNDDIQKAIEFYHFVWVDDEYVHILFVDSFNKLYMVDRVNKVATFGYNYNDSSSYVSERMFNTMLSYFSSKYKELKVR